MTDLNSENHSVEQRAAGNWGILSYEYLCTKWLSTAIRWRLCEQREQLVAQEGKR